MWLLNTSTKKLKEFVSDEQAPSYAILSHTWGDEEVSFQEWQELTRTGPSFIERFYNTASRRSRRPSMIEQKEGFRKIMNFCNQAVADNYEWVWADT
jgi:hypothetical protein